jgi:hypothetical protein
MAAKAKNPRLSASPQGAARRNAAPTFFDAERGSRICGVQGVQACNLGVPILEEDGP